MPQPPSQEKIARSIEWFFKNWHLLAGIAGALTVIYAAWLADSKIDHVWIYWVAGALTLAGMGRGLILKPSYVELLRTTEQNEETLASHQAALKGVIETSLRALTDEVDSWNEHSRISCYTHNGNAFVMMARLSNNPHLATAGRAVYPEDQGVIAVAWKQGKAVRTGLPVSDTNAYRKMLSAEYRMTAGVVDRLSMKSASLLAVRVTDTRSEKHVGVVVLESTKPRGVTATTYKQLSESNTWRTFQTLMSTSADMLPNMAGANQEGF